MHLCHARGCEVPVPPHLLMCLPHWNMVATYLKAEVWRTYRRGQEVDKSPSREYLHAAHEACKYVYQLERRRRRFNARVERYARRRPRLRIVQKPRLRLMKILYLRKS